MLNLLRKWVHNRDRAIFEYWDGSKKRSIDPMVAYRRLDSHEEFNWEEHPILVQESPDTEAGLEALQITAAAVREAFGVQEFENGRGLTEGELVDLLLMFVEWMQALKKNTSQSPISPVPTVQELSESESDTKSSSHCGSTSIESKYVAAGPS